jgi:ribonuclease-3
VCKKALYIYSLELGLDKYIKMGAGAELTLREMDSVSAMYSNHSSEPYILTRIGSVKEFLTKTVIPHIENQDIFFYDYKSELKSYATRMVEILFMS